MKILHRYIWREFFVQFLICMLGFTVLGIGKIVFDYNDIFIGYRITLGFMWFLILNQIPYLWMDVLPAACLFGVILSFGRLLREREFEVIRLCGMSLFQIMLPLFIGVSLLCFAAFCWNDTVVPTANHRFNVELQRLSMKEDLPLLKENVVLKAAQNKFIYLKQVHHKEGTIKGVLIIETDTQEGWPRIITAENGRIKKGIWELNKGFVHEFDKEGALVSELWYDKMDIKIVNDITALIGEEKLPSGMRSKELRERYILSKQSGFNLPEYAVFYHQKFADPLISLILVFIAVPLTILTGRNSRWVGFVYCFLIIMGYYTMQVVGRNLGCNGVLIPWVAAWIPQIFFMILGLFLLVAVEQRR